MHIPLLSFIYFFMCFLANTTYIKSESVVSFSRKKTQSAARGMSNWFLLSGLFHYLPFTVQGWPDQPLTSFLSCFGSERLGDSRNDHKLSSVSLCITLSPVLTSLYPSPYNMNVFFASLDHSRGGAVVQRSGQIRPCPCSTDVEPL